MVVICTGLRLRFYFYGMKKRKEKKKRVILQQKLNHTHLTSSRRNTSINQQHEKTPLPNFSPTCIFIGRSSSSSSTPKFSVDKKKRVLGVKVMRALKQQQQQHHNVVFGCYFVRRLSLLVVCMSLKLFVFNNTGSVLKKVVVAVSFRFTRWKVFLMGQRDDGYMSPSCSFHINPFSCREGAGHATTFYAFVFVHTVYFL